jgi:DNA-directed RNA polymerase specialized sigma24 family protein
MERADLDRLALAAQAGDRDAEARLVDALSPLAEAIGRQSQIPGVSSEDLTAVSFVAMLRGIRSFRPGDQSVKTYCRKVIHRAVIDEARKAWRRPLVYSLDAPDEGGDEPLGDFVMDSTADAGTAAERDVDLDLRLKGAAETRMHRSLHALAGTKAEGAERRAIFETCQRLREIGRLTRRELRAVEKRLRGVETQPSLFPEDGPDPMGPIGLALVHREVTLAMVRGLLGSGRTVPAARRELRLTKDEMRQVMESLREEYHEAA